MAHRDGDWSMASKSYHPHRRQLDRLNKELEEMSQATVLAGDLNMAKTPDLYRYFMEKSFWQDTAASDNYPTYHKEFLKENRESQKIDCIFTRPDMKILSANHVFVNKIDGTFISGHIGLIAQVERLESSSNFQ